jgi:hypothetical protein
MDYPVTFEEVLDVMNGELSKFENITVRAQETIFTMVDKLVGEDYWGDLYKEGFLYLSAHYFALSVDRVAGSGTLSSESLGEISQGFTMPVNNPTAREGLYSTQYGRTYAEIRDTAIPSIDFL